jgi:RpiB/LacA/LacB family sugar-phosphate isomerase
MRIAIGSDHAGFSVKQQVKEFLETHGDDVFDLGTYSSDQVDYPDYVEIVALSILQGKADRGVLICGSGVGASIAANKIPGIRAGLCHDTYSAHQGVEHDHMNVLVLGARVIGQGMVRELVHAFVRAEFTKEERHLRRLAKVAAIEVRSRGGIRLGGK